MSWIKLDDQWMRHPKIIQAGRDARDLWLASLTWCAEYLTDGYFPDNLLPHLAAMAEIDIANCQSFAKRLVDVRLWERTENGYYIHDYTDYNPTKEQAEATKTARSVAGRAGGLAKASKLPSKSQANGKQNPAPSPFPSLNNHQQKEEDSTSLVGDLGQVQAWFITASGLPTFAVNDKLLAAYKEIAAMKPTEDDIRAAVTEVIRQFGDASVTGPWSIVKPLALVIAKRNREASLPPEEPEPQPREQTPPPAKPPASPEGSRYWQQILQQIQPTMALADFRSYILPMRAVDWRDGVLTIASPSSYYAAWANDHLGKIATGYLQPLVNSESARVQFVTEGI